MSEQKKATLIKLYKAYTVVDWIIAIIIIGTPIILIAAPFIPAALQGLEPDPGAVLESFDSLIYAISNIPIVVIVPLFIFYTVYTVFCFVLYIKVWPIKEIPKGFMYWFDWLLTIGLTAYELFIFYVILFGGTV
ncbi:MAG: hypothetical protein FWD99_09265 [Oscillospiraceae bacterium]|nr:hypothetical protein [Oscillospiraceae bacterium]